MTSYSRVGAVTGGNKGIGLAIGKHCYKQSIMTANNLVRQLALQYPKSSLNNGPLLIYLLARDKSRGEAAVQQIQDDAELKKSKALVSGGGLSDVKYQSLDITDSKSIQDLAVLLKKQHPDGIDFGEYITLSSNTLGR
jgi:carbonyl reductase 1